MCPPTAAVASRRGVERRPVLARVTRRNAPRRRAARARASDERPDAGASAIERAAWFGAETLGRALEGGRARDGRADAVDVESNDRPVDRASAIASIRRDYETEYFVSGRGAMAAYADDCEFADPFASFRGVDRFKRNVSNLGGMMRDVDLRITSFEETTEGLQTEWKFSCVLDLPWRPMLAASGGTTHVLNEQNLVVRHYERWDVEPSKVLRQLLKPASKIPENQAEVFMLSASSGDIVGALGASSGELLRVFAPLWLSSALLRTATHTDATGIESLFGGMFLLACVAQVAKFLRGVGMS